jgi:hypothetical protein
LIPKDLATSTTRLTEIRICCSLVRLSRSSPLIRQHLRRLRHRPSRVWWLGDVRRRVVKAIDQCAQNRSRLAKSRLTGG